MPKIVQFLHPGAEHRPDRKSTSWTSWNTKAHRRKFLLSKGRYVENGTVKDGELTFWGEWEPPSEVRNLERNPQRPFDPTWLHRPILPKDLPDPINDKLSYQNTDPLVFGDAFRYFVCKQFRPKRKTLTMLSRLEPGSMLLFGSAARPKAPEAFFQLDTVFVVGSHQPYNANDRDALSNQGIYRDFVYKMAFPTVTGFDLNLRLYVGATFENRFEGMYSFAPCRPWENEQVSVFPRVPLRGEKYITNNLAQGYRISEVSTCEVVSFWKKIVDASRKNGCFEGVQFNMPPSKLVGP